MEFKGWLFNRPWKILLFSYILILCITFVGFLPFIEGIEDLAFKLNLPFFITMVVWCSLVAMCCYFIPYLTIKAIYGKNALILQETFTIKKQEVQFFISSSTKEITIPITDIKYIRLKLNTKGKSSFIIKTSGEKYTFTSLQTDLKDIKSYLDRCRLTPLTSFCKEKNTNKIPKPFYSYYYSRETSPKNIRQSYTLKNTLIVLSVVIGITGFMSGGIGYFLYEAKQEKVSHNPNYPPSEVEKYYWGMHKLNPKKLQRLSSGSNMFELYTDSKALYYYSFGDKKFYHRADIANLEPYKNNLFSDGNYLYFTKQNWISRTRNRGNIGSQMTIYRSEIKIDDIEEVYSDRYITLYKYQNQHLLNIKESHTELHTPYFKEVLNLEVLENNIEVQNTHSIEDSILGNIKSEKIIEIRERL